MNRNELHIAQYQNYACAHVQGECNLEPWQYVQPHHATVVNIFTVWEGINSERGSKCKMTFQHFCQFEWEFPLTTWYHSQSTVLCNLPFLQLSTKDHLAVLSLKNITGLILQITHRLAKHQFHYESHSLRHHSTTHNLLWQISGWLLGVLFTMSSMPSVTGLIIIKS